MTIRGIRQFADFPRERQDYVKRMDESVGVKVSWVANGPEQEAVIQMT
jgi:adenylosuccinate synthase